MVTEITGAVQSYPAIGQLAVTSVQRSDTAAATSNSGLAPPDTTPGSQAPDTSKVTGAYAQLQVRQDGLNKAAATLRQVGSTMDQATQLMGKVENKLDQIVKMFPPYPIGNPDRIALLNQVEGLRKQIEQLTFPPPEAVQGVGQVLGDKTGVSTTNATAVVTAGKQHMWDIPSLSPTSASDAQVSSALNQVKDAKSALQDLQAGMWRDVVTYVQQPGIPAVQAAGVRNQLVDLGGRGISNNPSLLVQAAESP